VSTGKQLLTFRRNLRLPDPKYEGTMIVRNVGKYQSTLRNIPEELDALVPISRQTSLQASNATRRSKAVQSILSRYTALSQDALSRLPIQQRLHTTTPVLSRPITEVKRWTAALLGLKCNLLRSSGMWRRVVWCKLADFSEEPTASILRVPEDGGNRFLRNTITSQTTAFFTKSFILTQL
jgi:hypothetical protein